MPGGREKPLHLQSTTELWVTIIGFPALGGVLLSAPLMGTFAAGREWDRLWAVLFLGGFFGLLGVAGSGSRLAELHRRGERVPPGTARRPVLAAAALTALVMAAAVAVVLTAAWLLRLSGV